MDAIRNLLKDSLARSLPGLSPEDRLAMAWTIVCGKTLAGHGSVVEYGDEGVVRVEVSDRAWMEEMKNMRGHLEAELARIAGVKVSGLHFIVKRERVKS